MSHSVKYEFIGFDPNFEVRSFVSSLTERLHLNAPSDALLRLSLEKNKNTVCISCKIVARAGVFEVVEANEDPIQGLMQVEQKMNEQLNEWKEHRFVKSETINSDLELAI